MEYRWRINLTGALPDGHTPDLTITQEEVRVVKNIEKIPFGYHTGDGRYREWNKVTVSGRPLYCFGLPENSLKEIYLGRHLYRNVTKGGSVTDEELKAVLEFWEKKDIKIMRCEPDVQTWNLVAKQFINKS